MNNELKKAFDFIDKSQKEMLDLWEELVNIESGSHNKKGIDSVAEIVKNILDSSGFNTKVMNFEKAGNSIVGELSNNSSEKRICFTGHMDTVFKDGTVEKRPFTIKDSKAYGPGVIDMKGGIIVLLYAIKALNSIGYKKRPLKVVLLGDEEVGHANSTMDKILPEEFSGSYATFNCETGRTDEGIVIGRKGSASFVLEIEGVAAHSGNDYEKGRNAILEMAYKTIDIQNLTNLEEGTTFNVGTVNGGTAANIVPEHAAAMIDVRFLKRDKLPEIKEKLEAIAKKIYIAGTKSTLALESVMYPMEITEGTKKLFEVVRKTALEIGLKEPYGKVVGGASDSSYSVMAGVPTLCSMGVQGQYGHTDREYGDVNSLFERTKLLVASILKL